MNSLYSHLDYRLGQSILAGSYTWMFHRCLQYKFHHSDKDQTNMDLRLQYDFNATNNHTVENVLHGQISSQLSWSCLFCHITELATTLMQRSRITLSQWTFLPWSQIEPVHPWRQVQWKVPSALSEQVPPFWQGLLEQGSSTVKIKPYSKPHCAPLEKGSFGIGLCKYWLLCMVNWNLSLCNNTRETHSSSVLKPYFRERCRMKQIHSKYSLQTQWTPKSIRL